MSDRLDWIELVVKASKFFGANPVRVRWKLRAWQNSLKARRDRAMMEGRSLTRGLKTCPACGAIAGSHDQTCGQCGAHLYSAPIEFFRRLFRRAGFSIFAETAIAIACVAAFAVTAIASINVGLGSSAIISPSASLLFDLGGNLASSTVDGQWWRLWTSVFLHGGIVHLGFNLVALYYVAPRARDFYGSNRMLFAYAVSGVAASAASTWWSLTGGGGGVSIGASGAIAGLIGLMLIRGWLDRSRAGIEIRNQMLRWMAIILVFGFFIGADNAAHIGGFAAGTLLGTAFPRSLRSRFSGLEGALGTAVLLAMAAAVAGIGWLAYLAGQAGTTIPVNPPF